MARITVNYESSNKRFEDKTITVDSLEYLREPELTLINAILAQIPDIKSVYEFFIEDEE